MAKKKTLEGKAPQSGNKVSHSHRKSRRRWIPNFQRKSLYSMALGRSVRVILPVHAIRSVDRAGGLDSYLLAKPAEELDQPMRRIQELVRSRVNPAPTTAAG